MNLRGLACFLLASALLCYVPWASVLASQDNTLAIQVTADKPAYEINEVATLTIQVVNNTAERIYNLQMQNVLPAGLEYVPPSTAFHAFPMLEPGGTATHTLQVRIQQAGPAVVPTTGDASQPLLWSVMAMLAAVGVCMMLRRQRELHSER